MESDRIPGNSYRFRNWVIARSIRDNTIILEVVIPEFRELVESIPESVEVIFDPIPEFRELMELILGAELVLGMCNIAE
jgi:hypothetical protein